VGNEHPTGATAHPNMSTQRRAPPLTTAVMTSGTTLLPSTRITGATPCDGHDHDFPPPTRGRTRTPRVNAHPISFFTAATPIAGGSPTYACQPIPSPHRARHLQADPPEEPDTPRTALTGELPQRALSTSGPQVVRQSTPMAVPALAGRVEDRGTAVLRYSLAECERPPGPEPSWRGAPPTGVETLRLIVEGESQWASSPFRVR
jgi:hypothetical protein